MSDTRFDKMSRIKKRFTVCLEPELYDKLDAFSKRAKLNRSATVEGILDIIFNVDIYQANLKNINQVSILVAKIFKKDFEDAKVKESMKEDETNSRATLEYIEDNFRT